MMHRDIIKYIAIVTMFLNHISAVFMEQGSFWSEFFRDAGYFTAVTMCYFLVEGMKYTRSKKNYAIRLAVFALISEIPFCLAFTKQGLIKFCGMNMIFTLLLCLLMAVWMQKVSNRFLKSFIAAGCILISMISDWAFFAPIFTILFLWAGDSRRRKKIAFAVSALLFGLFCFAGGISRFSMGISLLYGLGSMAGIAASGIVILYFYDETEGKRGDTFSKWFFYWFYPVHLLLLGILRIVFE